MNGSKLQAQFDAVKVLNDTQSKFEMVQILDVDGNVVNEDLVPDLTDEQLVELMEKWCGHVFLTNVLFL